MHNGIKVTFRIGYKIVRQYPQKKQHLLKEDFIIIFLKGCLCLPRFLRFINDRTIHFDRSWHEILIHAWYIIHKCKIWRLACVIWKLEINAKLMALSVLPIFWTIFKPFKQLLCAFIRVPGSFIDFDVYFKALIHFHELHFINFI